MTTTEPTIGVPWAIPETPAYPPLKENIRVPVVIVGGGMTGITTAYLLAKVGIHSVVLEADRIGAGATGATTAMVSQVIDTALGDLRRMYGAETTRLIWQAGRDAIDLIAATVQEEGIDCDFAYCPAYVFAGAPDQSQKIKKYHADAHSLGIATRFDGKRPLGFRHYGIWEVTHQAKFHPLKYLTHLAKIAHTTGAYLYEQTKATNIKRHEGLVVITTPGGTVTADTLIMCTYQPFKNPVQTLFKKAMYVSYELELQIPRGVIAPGLYWDAHSPYHYFRVDAGETHDRMLVGGEDHRRDIPVKPERRYHFLQEYVKHLLKGHEYTVLRKWKGNILESSDGLALIGEYRPHEYIATAFSGTGMTYAHIAAMMFRDVLTGKKNPYADIFRPTRTASPMQLYIKGRDYLQEFIGGVVRNLFRR